MGKANHSATIVLNNEKLIWNLRIKGYSQGKIAEQVGIGQQQVSRILKKMNARYYKEIMDDIKNYKADQLAKHELIIEEAMEAWFKSKQHGAKRKVKGIKTGDTDKRATMDTFDFFGETQYLDTAMKAMEHQRKILGIDKPDQDAEKDKIVRSVKIDIVDVNSVKLVDDEE